MILAQQLATLDQVSEGRLVVGVGIAADRPNIRAEFEAAGVPFDKRVGRLLEGLRLMRALWRGEPVSWDGHWTLREAVLGPLPHREGGPPIWGAGSHPNALARAGRAMDGWLPIWPDEGGEWRRMFEIVKGHATAAGRPQPTGAHYLTCCIDGPTAALARVDDFLERYYGVPGAAMRRAQACFGGSAEQTADWIQDFVDAGVEHIVLRFVGDHAAPPRCVRRTARTTRLVTIKGAIARRPLPIPLLASNLPAESVPPPIAPQGRARLPPSPPANPGDELPCHNWWLR